MTALTTECEVCGRPAVAIVTGRRDEGGYLPEIFVCEEHEEDWREEYDRN